MQSTESTNTKASGQGLILQFLQVICNGEEVLTTAGTKETYTVEIWSGNHPFYQGEGNVQLKEDSRVAAFNKRYAVRSSFHMIQCWMVG